MKILKNENPTETEKQMYSEYGLYPIDICPFNINVEGNTTNFKNTKYAVCYTDPELRNDYPSCVNIDEQDAKSFISFDTITETIKIGGYIDLKLLSLITQRAKELGYGKHIRVERNVQ